MREFGSKIRAESIISLRRCKNKNVFRTVHRDGVTQRKLENQMLVISLAQF